MKEEEYKERVKKLQEVNGVITKLDPAIREHAFKLLEGYITGNKPKHTVSDGDDGARILTMIWKVSSQNSIMKNPLIMQ